MKFRNLLIFIMLLLCTSCTSQVTNYYTGTVENDLYNIGSEISGKLDELYVQEGQFVKSGDKLFKINIDELSDEYNSLKAQVEAAQAKFNLVLSGNRIEELNKIKIEISKSDEVISSNRKSMDKALDDYNISKDLFSKNGTTLQSTKDNKHIYELSKSKYDSSLKEKRVLQEQLELLKKGSKSEEIDYYEKELESVTWKLKAMEKKLQKEFVYAPIDGMVENILIKQGELLNYGTNVVRISDNTNLWVNIYVEETKLAEINVGDELVLKRDDGETVLGNVFFIAPIGQFTPKNLESKESKQEVVFLCKIKVENIDMFKPGMLVDVFIGDENYE